jgi:hypothetical protein
MKRKLADLFAAEDDSTLTVNAAPMMDCRGFPLGVFRARMSASSTPA